MNQNKGIGAYKDRPGYFMGGMIGGAILGALVNKMQGKDVMRGAMWGGITGGLGSAFVGSGSTAAGSGWLDKMAPGITKSMFTMGSGNPALFGSLVGGAGAWMAGDPKKDRSDYEAWMEEEEAKRRKKQNEAYKYWHTNPWATGGMVAARPGYYNGGGAWSGVASDEEIPGSAQDKIMSITGQGGIESLGGLEDILESLDMASGPGQGDLSGWHEMFLDLQGKGEIPGDWDFNDFMENLDALDISPTDFGARGGYKTRPKYRTAGLIQDEEDEEQKRMMELVMMNARLKQPTGRLLEDTITRSQQEAEMMGLGAGSEETVGRRLDFLENRGDEKRRMLESVFEANLPTTSSQRGELEDEDEREKRLRDMVMMAAKLKQPTGRLLEDTINRSEEELKILGTFGSERRYDYIKDMMNARAKEMVESEDWEGSLHPGQRAELEDYFARYNPMAYRAEGGIADLDMTGGGASYGPGTGTSDDIPAMLSDGEFVVTANAVKNLGGGDRMLGAKKMYSMMNQLDPNSQTPAEMNTVGIA